MTKQKVSERDDLLAEYNNRRRWLGDKLSDNESLQRAFPRYADKGWSVSDLRRKIRDIQFFGKDK
jgi:hypothetical protein